MIFVFSQPINKSKDMLRSLFFSMVILLSVSLASCGEMQSADTSSDNVGEIIGGPAGAAIQVMEEEADAEMANQNLEGTKILIETDFGNMTAILYDKTPQHRDNFIKLAKEGFYNDLLFHRVIKGFMIQGGDPDSKGAAAGVQLGGGGPGYTVPAEIMPELFHQKGALSAARTGDNVNPERASSGSQFYIVQGTKMTKDQLTVDMQKLNQYLGQLFQKPEYASIREELNTLYMAQEMDKFNAKMMSTRPIIEKEFGVDLSMKTSDEKVAAYTTLGGTPSLDNQYTVFGQVIEGLDVIDKIAAVKTAPGDRPVEDVKMKVSIIE